MDDEAIERETQTLLNRLLFLYFIQRKGWLDRQRDYLYEKFRQHARSEPDGVSYYSEFLQRLFIRLSSEGDYIETLGDLPFLNGGLFDDDYGGQEKQEVLAHRSRMMIGNAIFRRVFDELLEAYNFTVREDTPLNQEVAIDPEMLGKIFESLVLQLGQSESSGKTSRHDTGSYYTPRPIVHYLCREGLRCWLVHLSSPGHNWPDRLEKLLALDASDGLDDDDLAKLESCFLPEEARALLERLDNLRACDPAVGSGAFPVGLLHELLNLRRLCEIRSRGRDPVEGDRNWLFDTKARIIERVIYAVDIQERAVEICKLRLWLSLMVDFDPGVDIEHCSQKAFVDALKKIPALPNLDFKIRRANSLVDIVRGYPLNLKLYDADDTGILPPILKRLVTAKRAFYDAHKIADKRRLRFDILDATAELAMYEFTAAKAELGLIAADEDMERLARLWGAEREMAQLRQQIRSARRLSATLQDDALKQLTKAFEDEQKPTFVWQLDFAEVFHRLPALATRFDLVIGNPPYGIVFNQRDKDMLEQRYRTFARNNEKYVAFTHRGTTLLSKRGVLAFITPNTFLLGPYYSALKEYLLCDSEVLRIVDFGMNQVFADPNVFTALLFVRGTNRGAKTQHDGCLFGRVEDMAAFPESVLFDKLAVEELTTLRWMPANKLIARLAKAKLKLRDVAWVKDVGLNYWTRGRGKKRGNSIADRVLYNGQQQNRRDKPYLKGRDIERFRVIFSNRWLKHNYADLLDPAVDTFRFSSEFLEPIKIVYRQTADELIATIDPSGMLVDKTLHVILIKEEWKSKLALPYLLGLLNSKLLTYTYRAMAQEEGRTFAQVKTFRVRELPLPDASDADQTAISRLVEKCLDSPEKCVANGWTEEIDRLVFRLYGLTDDEIARVEATE